MRENETNAPFHYNDEYYSARKKAIILGVIAIVMLVPLVLVVATIGIYNSLCAGTWCDDFSLDGSTCTGFTCESCTPVTAPLLFTLIFIWGAAGIAITIFAISYINKAKSNKIPIYYTPQELALMDRERIAKEQARQAELIYIPEYYVYRRNQIVFGILAGVCGFIFFLGLTILPSVVHEIIVNGRYDYTLALDLGYPCLFGLLHGVGMVMFIIQACKNAKMKALHKILKMTNVNPNQQPFMQNPNAQSPYEQMVGNFTDN